MKKAMIVAAIVGVISIGGIGYFAYQKWAENRGMITETVVRPLSEEKEAFEITDPPPEETRQYPLEIVNIKPSTENVPEVRQIAVTFNKPMIPLGDFEKSAQDLPIIIEPAISCEWRWLNRISLACQLDQDLPPSNHYQITIEKDFKAFDGTQLGKDHVKSFSTEAWRIVRENSQWRDADLPVYYWTFNQPMNKDSIQKQIISNCGPVKISRIKAETAERFDVDRERSYAIFFGKKIGLAKKCSLKLPGATKAAAGDQPGMAYSTTFQTYPEFEITQVRCQYGVSSKKPEGSVLKVEKCDPDTDVTIEFSSPIYAKDLAGKIKVEPFFGWSKGGYGSPEYFKQNPDETYQRLVLRSPLNGRDEHVIKFSTVKDQFNRPLKGAKTIKVSTIDFRPQLNIAEGYGVLEKKGPHQIAYNAVNLESFKLDYHHSQTPSELDMWRYYKKGYEYCQEKLEEPSFSFISKKIPTHADLNRPIINPIDLSVIAPSFSHGMFLGHAKSPTVLEQAKTTDHNIEDYCHNFFLVVTDLGVTAKVGFYDSGVWIHSISTGKPLSDVQVQLRGYSTVLTEGKTDAQGFVKLAGASQWDPNRNKYKSWDNDDELFVVAKTKEDLSVLPFYQGTQGIDPYSFSSYDSGTYFYSTQLSKDSNNIVHAITDRPLYQPGQNVKIKLFARHWEPRTFGLKPAKAVQVTVHDSLGKEIHKTDLELSPYGTISTELQLESSSPLGVYSINAQIGKKWNRTVATFDVQEFTLPAFKVGVKAIKTRFLAGMSAAFRTSAQYHFGGGLANTEGTYTVSFQEQQWSPTLPKWKSYTFDDQVSLNLSSYDRPRSRRYLTLQDGKLTTSKEGDSFTRIVLSQNQIRSFGSLTFEAKFQDDKGKTIAGRTSSKVYYADFQLGLKKDRWSYEAGEDFEPEVILLSPDEKPVTGRPISLKLIHRKYQTVRTRGTGNYFGYETKTLDKVVDKCETISQESGSSCSLTASAAGSHFILAEARDKKNRLTQSSLHLYVTGPGYIGWHRENHDRIDIIPDKENYKVGEEVSLLVKNPYEEVDAIFTLERFGILKQFRRKLTGGAEIVKIPLDEKDYAPGFYVSVHLIKGRVSEKIEGGVDLGKPSFKMGLAKIEVVNPDSVLDIHPSTDKKEYQPGEEVQADVVVQSSSGKKQSELAIAVVDEKILQLAGNYKGKFDLHDKFYQIPGVEVKTSQMLSFLIGRRHFGRKGAPEGGDGAGLAVRKDFLPLAYWNPSLETDSSGRAKFSFKVPDNLTSWRIIVVAVDKEHRFGLGEHSFKTNKKVMIEPALPSFLSEGDQLKTRFSVFNRTSQDGLIRGDLSVEALELIDPSEVQIEIPSQGKGFLEWLVKAPFDRNTAILTVKAQHQKTLDGDAAQYKFPIRPFVSYEVFGNYGSSTRDSVNIPVNIPPGIRPNLGGLELIYSSSLISHMDEVFRYVLDYPYACWEQKLTKALMLSSYQDLKSYISLPELKKDPNHLIRELLNEMPNFQAPNGGMSFWKPDLRTVDPYLSVFTALGMAWLNQSKVPIPETSANNAFKYTKNLLAGKESFPSWYSQKARATVLAMAAYVRSLLGDDTTSSINRIFQDKDDLSLFGKSFLWSAAAKSGSAQAISQALKEEIWSMADLTAGKIQFQEVIDDGFQRILHSTTRTNCRLLVSLLEHDPKGPFVEPLVRWIIDGRKSNHWSNTQENLFCLNALSSYASIFEKDTPDFKVSSKAFGKELRSATFEGFQNKPVTFKVGFEEAQPQSQPQISIQKDGKGRLYYTTRLRVAYQEVRKDAVNSGMQVRRAYYTKNKGGKWVLQTNEVRIKRGDLVRIELRASTPATRYQVALADSLPAGLEPLNTALAATAQSEAQGESDNSKGSYFWSEDDNWWGFYLNGGFYHREMRLFGAQYFADFLARGDYTLRYIAQAIAVGEFNVAPAVIEEMYEPEVYGKSTPAKFIITE